MGYNGVANLALVIILLKCVTVLSESVSFERKQNVDIFKNNGRKCYQMAASVYEQGWCKCDFEKMFVGDKCVVKRTMSGKCHQCCDQLSHNMRFFITLGEYS